MHAILLHILGLQQPLAGAPIATMPEPQCISLIKRLGFRLETTPQPSQYKLVAGGVPVNVYFVHPTKPNGIAAKEISGLSLTVAWDGGRPLTSRIVEPWAIRRSVSLGPYQGKLSFLEASLDNLARLRTEVPFGGQLSEANLSKKLRDFCELGRDLRTFLGDASTKPVTDGWSLDKAKLDMSFKVRELEDRDAAFLVHRFGWTPKHIWGGSGGGWFQLATIGGEDVWIHPLRQGADALPNAHTGIEVRSVRTLSSAKIKTWIAAHPNVKSWARVAGQPDGRLTISQDIDCTNGKTISAVRDEIVGFASRIKKLRLPDQPPR